MATIQVPGVGTFTVDDSFGQLPANQQAAEVDAMVSQVKGGQQQQPSLAAQPAPQEAPQPSMLDAAEQSVIHGLPAALASGAATIGKTIEDRTGYNKPWLTGLNNWLDSLGSSQGNDYAQNYQRPADVDPSISHALVTKGAGAALRSLGYSAAENAGPLLAQIGLGGASVAAAPETGGASLLGIAPLAALASNSVRQGRKAAGLDSDGPMTDADLANMAIQTGINLLPGGSGAGVKAVLGNVASNAAKGGIDSLVNAGSEAEQGGNVGGYAGAAQSALDAALTTGAVSAGSSAAQGAAKGIGAGYDALSVGSDFRRGVKDLAKARASGQVSPSLTPAAQRAQATLDLGAAYQARKASEAASDPNTSVQSTINGLLDTNKAALGSAFDKLKQLGPAYGGVSKDDHKVLTSALQEASKHTASQADQGLTNGSLATFRDQIAKIPMNQSQKQNILSALALQNAASYARIRKNSSPVFGPGIYAALSKGSALLGPALGLGAALTGHSAGEALEAGGLGSAAAHAVRVMGRGVASKVAKSQGGRLDAAVGIGVPVALQKLGRKQAYADGKGVGPSVTGPDIQNMIDALSGRLSAVQGAMARRTVGLGARPQGTPQQGSVQAPIGPQGPSPSPATQQPVPPPAQQAPQASTGQQGPTPQAAPPQPQQVNLGPLQQSLGVTGQLPGWLAATAQHSAEKNPARVVQFLHNQVAKGNLSAADRDYMLSTDNIGPTMYGVQNAINDLHARGQWHSESADPSQATPQVAPTPSLDPATGKVVLDPPLDESGKVIRNIHSYNAAIRASDNMKNLIDTIRPDLAVVTSNMVAGKGPKERTAIMNEHLKGVKDDKQKDADKRLLSNLTQFGSKTR